MDNQQYKKMAGTRAVFVFSDSDRPSPVERDGLIWSAQELHRDELSEQPKTKSDMANALALEGLEDYDPPQDGDLRKVISLDCSFMFLQRTHCWLQVN